MQIKTYHLLNHSENVFSNSAMKFQLKKVQGILSMIIELL